MVTVELIPAFVWDCDHCGRENFQRSVSRLLRGDDRDEAAQIRFAEGLPPGAPLPPGIQYRVDAWPDRVACRKCKVIHRAAVCGGRPFDEEKAADA